MAKPCQRIVKTPSRKRERGRERTAVLALDPRDPDVVRAKRTRKAR